jgi:GT2 family glycosyltransferase
MPTISVIIPAYNAERTILETIASVQKQTFLDLEIIAIDDGSTDKTAELLKGVTDERLKIFYYENSGVATARNRGISKAAGEFIAFLDADDLWTPDKLELQLTALQQHPEAGVAYSWNYFFVDGKEEIFSGESFYFEGNVYPQLLVQNFLANGSNPLIRSKIVESVGKFDPTFPHCADWDFYLRLAAICPFVVVPKHQVFYRQSFSSMTSQVSKIDGIEKQVLTMLDKAYKVTPPEYQYLKNQSLAWVYEYCAQQYLQYSNDISGVNKAGQKLWQAICLHPQILLTGYAQDLIRWLVKKSILLRLPFLKSHK